MTVNRGNGGVEAEGEVSISDAVLPFSRAHANSVSQNLSAFCVDKKKIPPLDDSIDISADVRGRHVAGLMNGPSGRGRGRGRGGFRGNRFDRERERGPQIDTWTNETAENAEKENSST